MTMCKVMKFVGTDMRLPPPPPGHPTKHQRTSRESTFVWC